MRRTEIQLSEPFEEILASLLTLPSTLTQIDEVRFAGAADSDLRKSAKCDAEVKETLRSVYEAAHGRQVETQIGFMTIAPPVADFLKEAPYYVTTQYEFFLEAFARLLAGASPRKSQRMFRRRHAANPLRAAAEQTGPDTQEEKNEMFSSAHHDLQATNN
jgi:hypothetical protein